MLAILGFASPFSELCTVTALSEVSTDMAGSNVLRDDLSRLWRSNRNSSIIRFDFASTRFLTLDSIYMAGHNLDNFTSIGLSGKIESEDSWEVWVSDNESYDIFQRPATIQEQTNLATGTGFISYDVSSTTTLAAFTSTPGTTSRLRGRFIAPPPLTLPASPLQLFWASYSTTGSGTLTLTVRLKEAGVLRATLSSGVTIPASMTPSALNFTWDGTLLTGSTPEIELEVVATGTAAISWHVVRWDVAIPDNPPSHYYSGLLPILSLYPTYRRSDNVVLSERHFIPVQTVRRAFIRLNRGTQTDELPQVGRIDGGLTLSSRMEANSWKLGLDPQSLGTVRLMRDGSERITQQESRLLAEVKIPPQKLADALEEKLGLALQGGIHKGYYWCFDSEDPAKAPYCWFFGRMTVPPDLTNLSRFFRSGFTVKQIR